MTVMTMLGTISASVDGVRREGEIREEARRFVAYVGGTRVGQAGSLEGAAHQLASELRRTLPRGEGWGVAVNCSASGRGLAFGTLAGGGGGGGTPDPCVARVLERFNKGESNLNRALEAAVEFLVKCCG